MSPSVDLRFRCPGEPYWIDRSTHLARLATGYLPCRSCSSRFQTDGLVPLALRDDIERDASESVDPPAEPFPAGDRTAWTTEGLAGTAENQIDAASARRFAMAFGTALTHEIGGGIARVAVGGDGRWLSARLVAAVSQGCQWAGCRVVEISGATAGSLAMVIAEHGLDGGILVGNALSAPETVSLKCWGPQGQAWSTGGGLELVRAALADQAIRSSRRFGGLERVDPTADYRRRVAELFHGLRPLRWVLDAASRPLFDHLRLLVAHSACEIIAPGMPADETAASDRPTGKPRRQMHSAPPKRRSLATRRLDRLRARVASSGADFGIWLDGDGDTLVLIDQQGRRIGPERLLWGIWRQAATAGQTVVLTHDCLSGRALFESAGARVVEVEATREAVDRAMRELGAAAAAGPGGRLWLAGGHSTSDALITIGWLLQWLSGQDRPLSEMLQ